MSEEIKTEQTNVEEKDNVQANSGLEQTTEESTNDFEFTDTHAEEENKGEESKSTESNKASKPVQTKEQNSEFARIRREQERQRELSEARNKAIIEALDGKNPYTNEPMTDSVDVEEYLAMKEIEKKGGDPIADYSKVQKQKQKDEMAKNEQARSQEEWIKKDSEDFKSKHPEVDLGELINNEVFQKFAEGKVGTTPMAKIYENFVDFTKAYEKKAKLQAAQMVANKKASPGTLTSPGQSESGFYSIEDVKKMSVEEMRKNWDKVQASRAKWNKKN